MEQSFEWSDSAQNAVQLLAEGRLEIREIADQCDVTRQTLWNWRKNPEFAAKLKEAREEIYQEVRRYGVTLRERRVSAVNDRWRRLQKVIEERAEEMAGIPGGSTGLLVRTYKSIGSGPSAREVEEYKVDTGLLAELREHEKQAAQELGQWIEKASVSVSDKPRFVDRAQNPRDGSIGHAGSNGHTNGSVAS